MKSYLYTITNGRAANSVVGMEIMKEGALTFVKGSPFPTGGKGSLSSQSQNSIWIDKDLVYAVDFGSSSFAIFSKNPDGTLARLTAKPISSHGNSPCSLCVSGGILYVLNQGVRSSGSKAEPSLAVFAIDAGKARYLSSSSLTLPRGESPTQVIANRQGTLLAVPSVRSRKSLVHFYKIDTAATRTGLLTELKDSPFAITDSGFGFGSVWKSDGKTFFMTNATGSGSVVRLAVDAGQGQIVEKSRATTPGSACWAALGKGEKVLYVANLLSLVVFDVAGNKLAQIQSADVTDVPKPVLRDLSLGPGGKFLYALEQRKRRILVYSVGKNGQVTLSSELAVGSPGYTLGLATT